MEGYFKGDRLDGFGRLRQIKDDIVYEGHFYRGNKEGWGIIAWPDGSVLEGEWNQGKVNGVGFYRWGDGREYKGEWVD